MNIYLAGCGKIGQQLGAVLQQDQHRVIGLKRSPAEYDFPVLPIDLSDNTAVDNLPTDADVIVFTVTPTTYDEPAYREVYETVLGNVIDWANRHRQPPLVLLVSSTSVYGQQNGEWVDEDSETLPTRVGGHWILFGENQLRARLTKTLTVRFSGIYGPQRTYLVKKATSGQAIQQTPPIWTNRIHEQDCVGVLKFFIECYQQGRVLDDCYLASDDTPVSQYDIATFICQQLGQATPPIKDRDLTMQCNKRCSNRRLKALGYRFVYPDYRVGYTFE